MRETETLRDSDWEVERKTDTKKETQDERPRQRRGRDPESHVLRHRAWETACSPALPILAIGWCAPPSHPHTPQQL